MGFHRFFCKNVSRETFEEQKTFYILSVQNSCKLCADSVRPLCKLCAILIHIKFNVKCFFNGAWPVRTNIFNFMAF